MLLYKQPDEEGGHYLTFIGGPDLIFKPDIISGLVVACR